MANEQNLKPWKKGQSGNPAGRPKGRSFKEMVAAELKKQLPGSDLSNDEEIARMFVQECLAGRGEAFAHLIKRLWPEVSKHEVTADVDLNAEMQVAAEDLRRMLGDL